MKQLGGMGGGGARLAGRGHARGTHLEGPARVQGANELLPHALPLPVGAELYPYSPPNSPNETLTPVPRHAPVFGDGGSPLKG